MPERVLRLFFDAATAPRTGDWTRVLARRRGVYRLVPPEELERIAGSVHHGGVVAVIDAPPALPPGPQHQDGWLRQKDVILALDGIGNPHNLGAIARSAAFFGVRALILRDDPAQARPGASAWRTSEGGLAHLQVHAVADLAGWLENLPRSFRVLGTALGRARTLKLSEPPPPGPLVLVLGNEEYGLTPEVARACPELICLPGGGAVQSLNVSAAAAVFTAWACGGRGDGR